MQLNLPISPLLGDCHNLLIAGMGGGFDVFCGLPIYFELQRRGQRVHLASFSFSDIADLKDGERLTDTVVGVDSQVENGLMYFPELHLARWFGEKRKEAVTIWCFQKTGARPLLINYQTLIKYP